MNFLKPIHAVNYLRSILLLSSLLKSVLILSSLRFTRHLVTICFGRHSIYACVSKVVSVLGVLTNIMCVILIPSMIELFTIIVLYWWLYELSFLRKVIKLVDVGLGQVVLTVCIPRWGPSDCGKMSRVSSMLYEALCRYSGVNCQVIMHVVKQVFSILAFEPYWLPYSRPYEHSESWKSQITFFMILDFRKVGKFRRYPGFSRLSFC
jgi:hypothetical protein